MSFIYDIIVVIVIQMIFSRTGLAFLRGELVRSRLQPGRLLQQLDLLFVGKFGQIGRLHLIDDVTRNTEA